MNDLFLVERLVRFYTGCSISLLNNERNDKKIMLKVKNVEIGSGIPKVCAPIVEKNQDDILEMGEILMAKRVLILSSGGLIFLRSVLILRNYWKQRDF